MQIKQKIYFFLFCFSVLTPFVEVIFFLKTTSVLLLLSLFVFDLIILTISTIKLWTLSRRIFYPLTSIVAVTLFFITYSYQVSAANFLFFKVREYRLTNFVELTRSQKIKQLSKRGHLSVNYTNILPDTEPIGTLNNFKHLGDILSPDSISKEQFEIVQQKLFEMDFTSFTTFEDGTISFTISGFLDNCYGLAYSETGKNPIDNDCGHIIYWEKVGDKWYAWGTT